MSFTIQDLINQHIFPDLRLVAGRKGVRNEITWVNIMEILDSPQSVQPGELLFTTGYGLQQEELYRDLIVHLSQRGVSGIAVQPGYYIDSIPSYLLAQADAIGFPILLLPKQLTFSEILHTMTRLLALEGRILWSDLALEQARTFLEERLDAREELLSSGSVHVLLLEPVNYTNANGAAWPKCLTRINSFLQSCSSLCLARELDGRRHVFLISCATDEAFGQMLLRLNIQLTLLSEQHGANYYLGETRLCTKEEIPQALQHGLEALRTLNLISARRGVCSYEHIEFLKMLGQMHRKDSSVILDNQSLQLLLNYDRNNGTDYAQTLQVYLSNSCNMAQTSRQLFLHRQTLIKRLEKICALGNLNLEDYYSRIYISMALLFHDYFVY